MIVHYSSKLLRRDVTFWITSVIILGMVVFIQLMELSCFGKFPMLGEFSLSSFFPYVGASMFSILQILPCIFMVRSLRRERLSTEEVFHVYAESNTEYVGGIAWAMLKTFLSVGIIVMLFSACIHLFFSNRVAFDSYLYIYYFLILIVPSLLFSLGISFWIHTFIKARMVAITLLLVFWGGILFFVGDCFLGAFDPTGFNLPVVFSDSLGYPVWGDYLLQRIGWTFLGIGLLLSSLLGFKRLSNNPSKRIYKKIVAVLLVLLGIVCLLFYVMNYQKRIFKRGNYIETAIKYAEYPRVALLSADLEYAQKGNEMHVLAFLDIQNKTSDTLRSCVLYLNPELKVKSLREETKSIHFERDNQVLLLKMDLLPDEKVKLEMVYEGEIDEDVCYLDVPDERYFGLQRSNYNVLSRFEKRNAFLEENYTLLHPEVLWYPMTNCPVNLKNPYLTARDFTYYRLRVRGCGEKLVISQGNVENENGEIIFESHRPLYGISLCMGDYEKHVIKVDSLTCELNIFKRDVSYWNKIKDYASGEVDDIKYAIENKMKRSYPFNYFRLIETPITFVSYYRDFQGGSEYVQPECVFIPEKFWGLTTLTRTEALVDGYIQKGLNVNIMSDLKNMLLNDGEKVGSTWLSYLWASRKLQEVLNGSVQMDNLYQVFPLFNNRVIYFESPDYPIINQVIQSLQEVDLFVPLEGKWNVAEVQAREYLKTHSFRQGIEDGEISPDILRELIKIKTRELVNYFCYKGIEQDSLNVFVEKYIADHYYQTVDFDQFNADFVKHFEVSWLDILPQWFEGKGLPLYRLYDFFVASIRDDEKQYAHPCTVRFAIFNDSDVDGIFRLTYLTGLYSHGKLNIFADGEPRHIFYLLKAKTGQEISLFLPDCGESVFLDFNLSENLPWCLAEAVEGEVFNYSEYIKEVSSKDYALPSDVIIVDNEDPGFSIEQTGKQLATLQASLQKTKNKYDNLYEYTYLDDLWRSLLDYGAYGEVNKSFVSRLAGNGKTSVSWETNLTRAGWYEVLVYLPKFHSQQVFARVTDNDGKSRVPPVEYKQYYELYFSGSEKCETDISVFGVVGWVSLGYFYGNEGMSKVVLSDFGVHDQQQILGDAVKWIYVGEDNPK